MLALAQPMQTACDALAPPAAARRGPLDAAAAVGVCARGVARGAAHAPRAHRAAVQQVRAAPPLRWRACWTTSAPAACLRPGCARPGWHHAPRAAARIPPTPPPQRAAAGLSRCQRAASGPPWSSSRVGSALPWPRSTRWTARGARRTATPTVRRRPRGGEPSPAPAGWQRACARTAAPPAPDCARAGASAVYGFGRSKRAVLYDTLLSTCTEDEVVAVLAHGGVVGRGGRAAAAAACCRLRWQAHQQGAGAGAGRAPRPTHARAPNHHHQSWRTTSCATRR